MVMGQSFVRSALEIYVLVLKYKLLASVFTSLSAFIKDIFLITK
jgi:hypothetical protein